MARTVSSSWQTISADKRGDFNCEVPIPKIFVSTRSSREAGSPDAISVPR